MRNKQSSRSAFSEPLFRQYYPSMIFSTLGSWILRFLLGWSAWDLTHSAAWVGIIAGLMMLPAIVLTPLVGALTNRINSRNGYLATTALQGVIAAIGAISTLFSWYSVASLTILAAALGIVYAAHTPIRLTLIPALVPRTTLPSAIGYSAITFNISRIVGPAIGAALVAQASISTAYLVSTILFACALPFLRALHIPDKAYLLPNGNIRDDCSEGLRYVRSHPAILMAFGCTLVNALLGRTTLELLPAISGQLLTGGSTTLAILTACAGAGSICGAFVVSQQSSSEVKLLKLVVICLALSIISLLPMAEVSGLFAISVLITCLSACVTTGLTAVTAMAQLLVEEEYRGRVLSLWSVLSMGAPAIGAVSMGALAQNFGFPAALCLFSGLAFVCILLLLRPGQWARFAKHSTAPQSDRST